MADSDRFQDNASGVITDNKYKKYWLPKDSWGDLGQWRNYNEAIAYVRLMNQVYAGGYSDWRLPTKAEAEGLFELDYDQIDWEEEIIHISTLFVSKCSNYIWTSDMDENKNVCRINLRNKESEYIDPNTQEHQAARLVRDK
ncbi:DUF1566 domain-containing protein [Nitrospinae bacterium]|jgi:hypothetical protein|nr:DUF1566 domain-containing protein [Nitrospinota bacterium]|tara:strand:- start:1928 stop:2350 length:423 start_codon:yes stop_codon:yes gene_type:complete